MEEQYILCDLKDLSEVINSPLKQTQRIKYTCFNASENYFVFGATSGSIYIFKRNPCTFLQLIPNRKGSINQILISPHDNFIAFSTNTGEIFIHTIDIGILSTSHKATTTENSLVTTLYWTEDEKQLYYGDSIGNVTLISLAFFMGRSVFHTSVHPILILDTPVVQIDGFDILLLVSTTTKCILCNTEREEFKPIGNRPRDGNYGACFLKTYKDEYLRGKIYCARPASRFWSVDFGGNVQQTHQFKQALAIPATRMWTTKTDDDIDSTILKSNDNNLVVRNEFIPQSLQFSKLLTISNELLLTYTDCGIYIFNPEQSTVILWNDEFKNIQSVSIFKNNIYVFTHQSQVFSLSLRILKDHISWLLISKDYFNCIEVMRSNLNYVKVNFRIQNELEQFKKLKEILKDADQLEILNILEDIESTSIKMKEVDDTIYTLNTLAESCNHYSPNYDGNLKNVFMSAWKGKFGKNIKFNLNLFSNLDDKKAEASKIITVAEEKNKIFKEIEDFPSKPLCTDRENEDIVKRKFIPRPTKLEIYPQMTDEEKLLQNLFMIYKSAKIGNVSLLDRYAPIFDKYTLSDIVHLLEKLEKLMMENGEHELEAKQNSIRLYFDYIKPELIWEVDDKSRQFIIDGFVLLNRDYSERHCGKCNYPLLASEKCHHFELGRTLFHYLWSRQEYSYCLEICQNVSFMLNVICKFYIRENKKVALPELLFVTGQCETFQMAKDHLSPQQWERLLFLYNAFLSHGNVTCFKCGSVSPDFYSKNVLNTKRYFYSWDFIFHHVVQYMGGRSALRQILKYSENIPNGAIKSDFYLKCLNMP